ncbi:MAG: ThiF family adenylyltransferase [Bacteroidota bacterium]
MDFSRIEHAADIPALQQSHIVIVGAGGSYNLVINLARCGVGTLTVLDFDTVEESNIVRQGYDYDTIGLHKVAALETKVKKVNPNTRYKGITKNFLDMSEEELDKIFLNADLFLFLTDSFRAQSFGNILALKYNTPALWAGWYAHSRTAEIFFQVPQDTPSCFRCAVSSRYAANQKKEVTVSSNANTIFHSELLDSYIGMLTLAILHRDNKKEDKECKRFYKSLFDVDGVLRHNFLQFKVHPLGGNPLFDAAYANLGKTAQLFTPIWQRIDPELTPKYEQDCPDCRGILNGQIIHKNPLKSQS